MPPYSLRASNKRQAGGLSDRTNPSQRESVAKKGGKHFVLVEPFKAAPLRIIGSQKVVVAVTGMNIFPIIAILGLAARPDRGDWPEG